MITLTQDADGFVRMSRHFPAATPITILFTDDSRGEYTGQTLNRIYDEALAAYRAANHLDAKGFSRAPAPSVRPAHTVGFVPVHAGMTA